MIAVVDPVHAFGGHRRNARNRHRPPIGLVRGHRGIARLISPLDLGFHAQRFDGFDCRLDRVGCVPNRERALHQVEIHSLHARHALQLAADQTFLGRTVHLRDAKYRGGCLHVLPRSLHSNGSKRLLDRR